MTRWTPRPTKEGPSGAGRSPRWYAEKWSPRRASSLAPPARVASSNAIFHPPRRRSGGTPSPSIRQRGRRSRAGTPITHIELGPSPADQSRRRQDDLTHRLVIADIAGTAADVRVQRLRAACPRSRALRPRHRPTGRIAMLDRRRTFKLGLVTLGLLFVAAPLDAFAQAKPPVKVRYSEVVRSILYAPAYVALANGYFKDAG